MSYGESVATALEQLTASHASDYEATVAQTLLERKQLELSGDLSPQQQFDLLRSRSNTIIPEDDLADRLTASVATGDSLSVKFGIDPTGADVHLGHAVPMVLLDRFQRMGHHVVFIVGDMTAKIGDPTGRKKDRPALTDEQIETNLSSYSSQVAPIFDTNKAEIRRNSEWLAGYDIGKLTVLLSQIRMAEIMQRDDFRTRLEGGTSPTVSEILYPVMMGIDSLATKPDIELGGQDQLLNLQMCRRVMSNEGLKPEVVMTTGILEGIGAGNEKMSKSLGNYISLTEEPASVFGKLMSIPDGKTETYFKSLTEMTDQEWTTVQDLVRSDLLHPMAVKRMLALTVTGLLHGTDAAVQAHDSFIKQFSEKSYDELEGVQTLTLGGDTPALASLASVTGLSKSELRRLAGSGAIRVMDEEGNETARLGVEALIQPAEISGSFLRVGKRRVYKLG